MIFAFYVDFHLNFFQCLLKIGDHIMEITSHYKDADVIADWRK